MSVIIDTSVWSQFFSQAEDPRAVELVEDLIIRREAVLVGIVKQELLSGIKEPRDSRSFYRRCLILSYFWPRMKIT